MNLHRISDSSSKDCSISANVRRRPWSAFITDPRPEQELNDIQEVLDEFPIIDVQLASKLLDRGQTFKDDPKIIPNTESARKAINRVDTKTKSHGSLQSPNLKYSSFLVL